MKTKITSIPNINSLCLGITTDVSRRNPPKKTLPELCAVKRSTKMLITNRSVINVLDD